MKIKKSVYVALIHYHNFNDKEQNNELCRNVIHGIY